MERGAQPRVALLLQLADLPGRGWAVTAARIGYFSEKYHKRGDILDPNIGRRTSLGYKIPGILIVFTVLFAAGPLSAHHSPSAVFDMEKKFSVAGTLTEVDWINPHIVVLLEAKKDDGSVETWKFESNPPSWFRRVGVARDNFAKAIGQTVTVEGVRAKNGVLYGYLLKITFPDGNSLELVFPSEPKAP